jgi:hypothetical protein
MKSITLRTLPLLAFLILGSRNGDCATLPNVDPCSLVPLQAVEKIFPEITSMEKQTVGPNTTCNYTNSKNFTALMVSASDDGTTSAHEHLVPMGEGYMIRDVAGLGDNAAVAIQKANPKFGFKEGIAELMVKKDHILLLLAPMRIHSTSVDNALDRLKKIAARMLKNIP